jgi:uncharacterized membrane protein
MKSVALQSQSLLFNRFLEISMTSSTLGLLAGLLIAIAATTGGFTGFLLAIVLGLLGWGLGAYRDGELDLAKVSLGRRRD